MTETSTVNATQEAASKFGTAHPAKQALILLKRIEGLEARLEKPKMTPQERMEKARAARGKKNEERIVS